MASLNRFFLCSYVFIFVSKIYCEGPFVKEKDKEYNISYGYYYFDFKFSTNSAQAKTEGYYYERTEDIIKYLGNKTSLDPKKYYIDDKNLYGCIFSNYNIIRRKIYKFDNYDEILEDFKQRIKNDYFDNFWLLISELNNGIPYNYNIEYKDLSEIFEIEYKFNDLKFSLNLKKEIDSKYLRQEEHKSEESKIGPNTKPEEPKKVEIKSATSATTVVTTATTATVINEHKEEEPKKEIKKNIILKRLNNDFLAPDAKDEFKDELHIKNITEKDDISNKIFEGLSSKFNYIQKGNYELYSDELGSSKIENINFDSITNDFTIYVKISQFYLDEKQKEAVDELKNIKLEDENNNIYSIYELIDKINSNIDKIKDHQFCKNFIKKYNNETDGLIKEYNAIIATLTDQCKNTINEINGINETLEEGNIENLKDNCIQNFKKAAGDYGSKNITGYIELSNLVADYDKAIEELDDRINLYKEYKDFTKTVESNVNKLIEDIKSKNIAKINNFEDFKKTEISNFNSKTKLDEKYNKYSDIFNTFVNNLKINFDNEINNKKSEFDKISLKNAKSKEIFDEIIKYLDDYQNSYTNINNIDDEKLKNTEETIEKEIKAKIDEILTKELESVDNKNKIEAEIKDKFKDKYINNRVNAILNIITSKKEELKIKFTLTKKNTENLKDEYLTKFNEIINKYQVGVRNNVKFSELKSEISEKNDIKLFKDANEVNYNKNIVKDSVIFVEFPDSYLVKIEIPKHIDEEDNDHEEHTDKENNDPNKKNHTDEENNNQENVDNSDIKNNTTTKKKCSNSGKEKTNNKKTKKPSCKQK